MTMEPCDCDILDHRGIPVIAVMGCDYNLYCSSSVQSLPCSDLPLFRQQLFQINRSRHVGWCGERFEGWMLLRGTEGQDRVKVAGDGGTQDLDQD